MGLMSDLYQRARDWFEYEPSGVLMSGEKPVTPEFLQTLHEMGLVADARMRGTDIPVPTYFYTPKCYRPKREGFLERLLG